jgi:hypothetical protein
MAGIFSATVTLPPVRGKRNLNLKIISFLQDKQLIAFSARPPIIAGPMPPGTGTIGSLSVQN